MFGGKGGTKVEREKDRGKERDQLDKKQAGPTARIGDRTEAVQVKREGKGVAEVAGGLCKDQTRLVTPGLKPSRGGGRGFDRRRKVANGRVQERNRRKMAAGETGDALLLKAADHGIVNWDDKGRWEGY